MAAKKVSINLLKEVPATTVVWKSMSGNFTSQDIIDMLMSAEQDKVDSGTQYVLDWFRLSRDILQARV